MSVSASILAEYEQRRDRDSDIRGHLPYLYERATKAKVAVELGVRSGESTSALLAGVEECDGKLYSIDIVPPQVPHSWHDIPRWRFRLGDDTDASVLNWCPVECDLLFIDTDHRYEHTLAELDLYGTKVKTGGVILLHDVDLETAPGSFDEVDRNFPVRRAVEEWCRRRFLTPVWREGWSGLGVIEVT